MLKVKLIKAQELYLIVKIYDVLRMVLHKNIFNIYLLIKYYED